MKPLRPLALLLLSFAVHAPVHAATEVVKCTTKGRTTYQEARCDAGKMKAVDTRPTSEGIENPSKGMVSTGGPEASGPKVSIIPVPQPELPVRSIVNDAKPSSTSYSIR
jgi:hypothetical protein